VDAVHPQIDEVHLRQVPLPEVFRLLLPLRGQPGHRRCGQPRPRAQELLQRRREIQRGQPVQIQQRQHLRHLRRLPRPRRQDLRRETMPLATFRVDPLVVHPRRRHRHRTGPGDHVPLQVVAVADHHPVPGLVQDVGELLDVRRDLGLQRRRQHLPGTVPDQLIQQRPRRTSRGLLRSFLSNYREHGRTFPTGVGTLALLEEPDGTSGRYALQAPQPEISHPQVSSIPPPNSMFRCRPQVRY